MRLIIAFAILMTLTALSSEVPAEVTALVEAYRSALSTQRIAPLEGLLADDFVFSGAEPAVSRMVLEQVLSLGVLKIGKIDSVQMLDVNGHTIVKFTSIIENSGSGQSATDQFEIVLDRGKWKIRAMGSGVLQAIVIEDPLEHKTFLLEGPPKTTLNFSPGSEHILVEALLAGKPAKMIIDNGSPLTVIDLEAAKAFPLVGDLTVAKAMGVSGDISATGAVRIDSLSIADIKIRELLAITMDLSHLSQALGEEVVGLLGTDFLGRFAWTIDYSSRRLYLNRLDNQGGLLDPEDPILKGEPSYTISFDREMHLLYTKAEFPGGNLGNVILDCGAGGGVLTPEFFSKIPVEAFETVGTDTLLGADKVKTEVKSLVPMSISIGHISRGDYIVVVSDLSHINSLGLPTPIDAIIGYNYFSDWLITTRFDKGEIELRPIPK